MERFIGWTLLALAVALGPVSARAAAADPSYPDTDAGRHARDFFAAYAAGDDALRAFFAAHVAAADLAERPADARAALWRGVRDEQGALAPQRVVESADDHVVVEARNSRGQAVRLTFACRPESPHALVAIQIEPVDDTGGAPPDRAPAGPPPSEAEIVATLGSTLDSLCAAGAFSGVVRLDRDATTLFERACGMASREANRPNTPDTRFDLGSINKIFTTVAIHQLAQQGKLRLDDSIARFLPDYPAEAARKITIRMLLEHRAGVPDVLRSPEVWKHPLAVRTASDWYRLVRDEPLEFEPGTKERYSNGGFVILGMIVERASLEDYYAYVRSHVCTPAGMTRTDYYPADHLPDDVAVPYTDRADAAAGAGDASAPAASRLVPVTVRFGRGSAAGGGYSTAGDLVRFARALRERRLLDAAHTEALIGPGPGGLGIAGGSPGVNALLEMSGPYTLVALANLDPPAAERIGRDVGRLIRRAGGGEGRERHLIRAGGPER